MRTAVPVLVILSLTHANQKYRKNLVAYTFWHHYWTNFVKTKSFSHYSEPSRGLQSVLSPPVKLAKFRMQYKIVSLK